MIAASLADNLLTAPVIAFLVAIVATLARFDVRLPESLYPILSTFLLLAIGLKGGTALSDVQPSEFWKPLLAAILLGILTPVIAFFLFRLLGKLDVPGDACAVVLAAGAEELPITIEHAQGVAALPLHHRDPFDRLLIAQALAEDAVVLSADRAFDAYGCRRRW